MSLYGNLTINLYSIAILVIIFILSLKSSEKNLLQQKLFMTTLLVTALMLMMDVLSRFDGHPGTLYDAVNHSGNFIIFLLSPVLPSLWLLYVYSQIENGAGKIRKLLFPLTALSAVNTVMLILSQFFGWYYTIGSDNIYHRGPLFLFPVTLTAVLTAGSFALVIAKRQKLDRKHFVSLLMFPIPPLAGIVLQIVFYGVSLILNGAVLSLLIVFVTIQNERMNTDYLTGVYNRKGLEGYIRQKIISSSEDRTFSAILLDLDDFKSINDMFGHNTGDYVLSVTSGLIRNCLRSDDFVARYGGDEFYIILNISDPDELEAVVHRLRNCIKDFNENSNDPFKIGFSLGYAVYDVRSHMSTQEFHKLLDGLMYVDKRAAKKQRNS